MPVGIAAEVKEAYETITAPGAEPAIVWATFVRSGGTVVLGTSGSDHDAFLAALPQDGTAFAYYRLNIVTDGSPRTKFALITWAGEGASPLKKGRLSIDKAELKQVIKEISVEIATSDLDDLAYEPIEGKVRAANY
ncbi:hypothetical protein ACIRD6_32235 [Streptomyces sp. NPDC102473]|uniref:hypothetical protein n=1 Tax=Streptomyces sp. NPDC102473 TaxID=3366180 RepID=UPI003804ABA1